MRCNSIAVNGELFKMMADDSLKAKIEKGKEIHKII